MAASRDSLADIREHPLAERRRAKNRSREGGWGPWLDATWRRIRSARSIKTGRRRAGTPL
jgi:hypothetical protein